MKYIGTILFILIAVALNAQVTSRTGTVIGNVTPKMTIIDYRISPNLLEGDTMYNKVDGVDYSYTVVPKCLPVSTGEITNVMDENKSGWFINNVYRLQNFGNYLDSAGVNGFAVYTWQGKLSGDIFEIPKNTMVKISDNEYQFVDINGDLIGTPILIPATSIEFAQSSSDPLNAATTAHNRIVFAGTGGSASGNNSIAAFNSIAGGDYSLAIGNQNNVFSSYGYSLGGLNTVSGTNATAAFGFNNVVDGNLAATAIGYNNSVNSTGGLALGYENMTTGNYAITIGKDNEATFSNSLALGNKANSNHTNSICISANPTNGASSSVNYQINMAAPGGYILSTNFNNTLGVGLAANGTSWTTLSDVRLKEYFQKMPYGLKEILRLDPLTFHYKGVAEKSLGLIAQMVEDVMPELVQTQTFGRKLKSINYNELIPVLVKAMQEQQEEIEALKKQIITLSE